MGTKGTGRSLPLATDGQSAAAALLNYGWRGARLLEGFFRKRPIHCIVQVSNRCNLSCGFCSFWERPAPRHDEMTVADFETIARLDHSHLPAIVERLVKQEMSGTGDDQL